MKGYVQESMYPAMEDYKIDLPIGQGPAADIITVPLAHFTLVGATTREGLLGGPFRDRFGNRIHLDYYASGGNSNCHQPTQPENATSC